MKKLYSACYGDSGHPFNVFTRDVQTVVDPADLIEQDSALIIWGGSDISPSLYNHLESKTTYPHPTRDATEWALAKRAASLGIPIFGVCRGAQMLCALAGGYLIQDVSNHSGSHTVDTYNGRSFVVNSIHHQMMFVPEEVEHEVLAWTSIKRSKRYKYMNDLDHPPPEKELEFVYFPKIKGYAVQWHPEGMAASSEATQFILGEIYARINTASSTSV